MNRKKYLLFVAGALALSTACSHQEQAKDNTPKTVNAKPVALVDDKQIYESEKINTIGSQVNEANKAYGSTIYQQGHDAYANKHTLAAAIALLKQSIQYYPSAAAYYDLGAALQDMGKPDEALLSYKMAVSQKYTPLGDVWYKTASIYAQQKSTKEAFSAMEYALDNDLSDAAKNMILTNHALDNMRANKAFSKLLSGHFTGKERKLIKFGAFVNSFPQGSLPFAVNDANVYCNPKNEIDYSYADFIPEIETTRFGREVSLRYSYIASLFKNDTFILLAYSSYNDLYKGDIQKRDSFMNKTIYISTFKPTGERIDKLELAAKSIPDDITTGLLRKDMVLSKHTISNFWKESFYDDGGYIKENIREIKETTAYYQIDKQGHFRKLKELPAEPKQAEQKLGMLR